jgi:hypothetical protein
MANRINAPMQPQQPSRPDPLGNPVGTEAEHHQLPSADNAPLAPSDPLQAG